MPAAATCTLGMLLAELGDAARLVSGDAAPERPIARAALWSPGMPVPVAGDTLIVCTTPAAGGPPGVEALFDAPGPLLIAVGLRDDGAGIADLAELARRSAHVVIGLSPQLNLADVVAVVARATRPAEERAARRLAQLQRTLSQALVTPSPIPTLLAHVKRTCNAVVALLDMDGRPLHTTGPLPLAILHDQIRPARTAAVTLAADGWHGVAQMVEDSGGDGRPFGWLVGAARRATFPDAFARAAIEITATLVETAHRIATAERAQDRAVRASVLEQLLAVQVARDDPDLSGRVAGLGIRFDDELRVLVVKPARDATLAELGLQLGQIFAAAGVRQFVSVRGDHVVLLAQCSPATARRALVAADAAHELQVGAGRRVQALGDVVDSYNDAQLAIRALQRSPSRSGFVAFEDFDFATRLFSNVGLDRMVTWAREFFQPLEGRDALLAALQSYFARGQNIKAAANDLFVHHNSLRYRLSKVEELLGISFTDPAAISSTYLALTALDLAGRGATSAPVPAAKRYAAQPGPPQPRARDTAVTDLPGPPPQATGVVSAPDR